MRPCSYRARTLSLAAAPRVCARVVSGRLPADFATLLPDGAALIVLQQQKVRLATGEDRVGFATTVLSPEHIVGIEFADAAVLPSLGLTAPDRRPRTRALRGSTSGRNCRDRGNASRHGK